MAGDSQKTVVEDSVHLLKFDDSPTKLDHHFYDIDPTVNFVVDGNQYYWIRIGSVKAKQVSTNAIAYFTCKGAIIVGAAGVAYAAAPAIAGGTGASAMIGGTTFTLSAGQLAALVGAGIGYIADVTSAICSDVEKQFVTNQYRVVASDGTILIGIAKTNTAGINELKKDGLDITKLTLCSSSGAVIPNDIATRGVCAEHEHHHDKCGN
jgi:alkylated DNA nucleotide flippase Atl1